MAESRILKDSKTGEKFYPVTSTDAVFDPQGIDLGTLLGRKVDNEQGKVLSSNDYTNADKQKLDSLPTDAELTTTLNGKQSTLQNSDDVIVDDSQLSVTERAKYASLIKQFVEAGGAFNETTQLGSLNGIMDLSYEDMAVILEAGRLTNNNTESFYANNTKLRTNLIPVNGWGLNTLRHTLIGCTSIEVFDAYHCVLSSNSFDSCKNLHTILDIFYNLGENLNNCFYKCEKLKSLKMELQAKAVSFSLANSPLVDLASFQYMVTKAANTTAITITVHPDVYAKLTGDTANAATAALTAEELEQWAEVLSLAISKNIIFATT